MILHPLSDYLPATIPSQITFGSTDRRFCFNGTIVDDDIAAEFLEDFVLTITSVSPNGVMIGTQDTVITIVDEDGRHLHRYDCVISNLVRYAHKLIENI